MTIINKTKNKILTTRAKKAKTFREKATGLIGAQQDLAIVFKTRLGIHTFAMRRSIDIVVLDKTKRVVEMKEAMSPNRIFLWHPKYNIVIELPKGTIEKTKTEIGDILSFP